MNSYGWLPRMAQTVARQAELMGCVVDVDVAATGSAYLTVTPPDGEDVLIRIVGGVAHVSQNSWKVVIALDVPTRRRNLQRRDGDRLLS